MPEDETPANLPPGQLAKAEAGPTKPGQLSVARPRDITLNSGRVITLDHMLQYPTYTGLLEGKPDNSVFIGHAVNCAKSKLWGFCKDPFLIEPVTRKLKSFPPGLLPETACIGVFQSWKPVRVLSASLSSLTVVWFQKEFAFPIEAGIIDQIKAIDWEKFAVDADL